MKNEIKDLLIEKVSKSLEEIYKEYSDQGMSSVYIWGSITTPDFNAQTSDIDTIAIVEDRIPLEYETKIQNELANKHTDVKKIGFRLLYKSELDTGIVKSALGKVGIPELLLLDLPTWKHICGINFSQKDFLLPVPNYDQALNLRLESTFERWPEINSIEPSEVSYFIKQILRIIHLIYLKRNNLPYTIFSYSGLKNIETDPEEENIMNICLALKANNWNYDDFKKHAMELEQYLKNLSVTFFISSKVG